MISLSVLLSILAAVCLIPPLYRGAVQDLEEFKFSEAYFDSLWVNAAVVLLVSTYLSILFDGFWLVVVEYLALSIISLLVFGFIGFRYGNGGDWRAMMHIAVIAPFVLFSVIIATALCGIVQAVYWLCRKDIAAPPMFRKIPFAVSIFCGYVIALIWYAVTMGAP